MLKDIRKKKGLSQSKLAQITGVKQGVISYIEAGRTKAPRIDTLQALAKGLECSVDDLVKPGDDLNDGKTA